MAGPRFFGLLALAVLALCAGYAALVLSSATWEQARGLDAIFPFYPWRTRAFSAAAFANTRAGLGVAAGVLGGTFAVLLRSARNRAEWRALGQELANAAAAWLDGLRALSPRQRQLAMGGLLALSALRVFFSVTNPEYDDAVSYEVFVSKGLLATSAYYPIPNNHIFSNTLSLLFYQASPGFWWSMRLPVLLISTGATVFWFAGLRRRASFRGAALATGLFSGLQLSLYHAGVGRGYWLMIGVAGVVFFAALRLAEGGGPRRAAWSALVVAGVLGCYTVPPFVYVLASAFSWVALRAVVRGQWTEVGPLAAAGGLIGLGTAALYAPLLLVSGLARLVGNGYVSSQPPGLFWRGLPAYAWHIEGFLAGQRTLGALLTLPVLALVGGLLCRARAGRLPADLARRLQQLGSPALWFWGLPYALLVAQRVFPPERVLLYKAFFFFILVGLLADAALTYWAARRGPRRALAAGLLLFAGYETYSVVRVNPAARGTNAAYHAGLCWLAARPPGPVLVPEPTHNLFFRFYAHSEMRQRSWRIDETQRDTTRYAYVVAFPNKRGFFQPEFPFPPAYHNAEVEIYAVPPAYPLRTQAWRH